MRFTLATPPANAHLAIVPRLEREQLLAPLRYRAWFVVPTTFTWIGFTREQVELLEFLDHLGNNGWARNSQTEAEMPKLMEEFADSGVTLARIKPAMVAIGYGKHALHELDRWESKRTTGRFGR